MSSLLDGTYTEFCADLKTEEKIGKRAIKNKLSLQKLCKKVFFYNFFLWFFFHRIWNLCKILCFLYSCRLIVRRTFCWIPTSLFWHFKKRKFLNIPKHVLYLGLRFRIASNSNPGFTYNFSLKVPNHCTLMNNEQIFFICCKKHSTTFLERHEPKGTLPWDFRALVFS